MKSWAKIFLVIAIAIWLAAGAAIVSRIQLVFDYTTLPLVPPEYEVIAGSAPAIGAVMCTLAIVALPLIRRGKREASNPAGSTMTAHSDAMLVACWLAASLPLWLVMLRIAGVGVPQPSWWELAWYAGWTGLSVRLSFCSQSLPFADKRWPWLVFLSIAVVACAGWWFYQSTEYCRDYQLGFNDFGHFTQRISNTANGYGFLLESPVLPPFWDHFNPGLLLLVPFWSVCPRIELIFAVQAVCLAGSAWLVAAIALSRGQSAAAASAWGGAWLLYPSIGQMNLAYTYGWHPITLAIPCLFAAYLFLCLSRFRSAMVSAVIAASFEEGVFVVIACYAAAQGLRSWLQPWHSREPYSPAAENAAASSLGTRSRYLWGWLVVTVVAVVGFVVVYRFSGLAPFQTSRFARLGSNAAEIVASPVMRPDVFWGLLLRPRNGAFVSLLLVPFLAARSRSWGWSLVAVAPPGLVLMIWEHMPAQSIAFQYASCLIPVLFAGIIDLPRNTNSPESRAFGMLAVVWILAISIGQMPWSNDSLVDVKTKTYGLQSSIKLLRNRSHAGEDGKWIAERIQALRTQSGEGHKRNLTGQQFPEWRRLRVLATGRVATHCVGVGDIETVGQFWQRYEALQRLDPKLASPILRYDVILLDFRESFQQTQEETLRVLSEAEKNGWSVHEREYEFAILRR